ncbi:hypothetical protein OIU84_009572 [Salix udensis]|uniref:Alpha/beta hydrolase fold-3 domain-containing protein n=1 Tax=Salix udensis TaxID=889485 RepID=A0AAD6NYU9_9ROSI|nr:hypothetical protein OIU84_009572 [Salix udensis]
MRLMDAVGSFACTVMAQSGVLLIQASKFLSTMMVLLSGKMLSLTPRMISTCVSTNQLPPLRQSSLSSTTSMAVAFALAPVPGPNCQNYCFKLALDLQAVIISPDYRLAPENRLPAAIEDGYMAVKWLQAQAMSEEPDTWLTDVADFSKVFISGDSAGGNIAHNLAVRLGAGSPELAPVLVRGYVLLAPYFGGTVKSKSEAEGPKEAFLNWELIDRFWRLSIPIGETTDHPLVNPFGPQSRSLEPLDLDPILVVMGGSDLLKDRAKDYAERLQKLGKRYPVR